MWVNVFISFGCISRSGIAGSCGNTMFEELPDIFQSSCTILHSHQHYMRVLISLYSHQHLISDFWNPAILVDLKWYLIVVLVCISLMTNDVESIFSCAYWPCIYLPYRNIYSKHADVENGLEDVGRGKGKLG